MKREELASKLKGVRAKIAEINAKEAPVYATSSKYIPNIGYVAEIPTLRECAKALAKVKRYFNAETEEAAALGIDESEIAADSNYLGHKLAVWQKDIQARVDELKDAELLTKLEAAEKTLSKHRTQDDIFNEDMESIGDVLASI